MAKIVSFRPDKKEEQNSLLSNVWYTVSNLNRTTRFALLSLLLLAFAFPIINRVQLEIRQQAAGTQAVLVQSPVANTLTPTSSVSASWTNATATGNILVAIVSANISSGSASITIAPAGWTKATDVVQPNAVHQWVYYYPSAPTQSGNVTFTFDTAVKANLILAEYSGVQTSSPLDVQQSATGTSATPSASLTPTTSNELVIAAVSANTAGTYTNPTNGYSLAVQAATSGGSDGINTSTALLATSYQTTGSTTNSVNLTAPAGWVDTALAFKLIQPTPTTATKTSTTTTTTTTDWPQLQYDAQHSGYISTTYGPPYTELWRKSGSTTPAMPPVSSRVQPVIAYNLVYIPSDNGTLYAFKTSDGTEAWHYTTGGALVNAAAVDNAQNIVYVGSTDNKLYALNAQTGALMWSYATNGKIRVAPVVANSTVYIASGDSHVYCLNGSTGAVVWNQTVNYPVLDTPAFYNGNLYVATLGSTAYALNGTTGAVVWTKQLKGSGFRDRWISAGNGKVFFSPLPYEGSTTELSDGAGLLKGIYTATWSSQRSSILSFLSQNPFEQPVYILDAGTGNEAAVAPILYTNGGSSSEYSQPVILPNGNFNVIYRYTEGQPNPGCGATCNIWAQYLGEYNPGTNDITQLDHWGSGSSYTLSTKIPFISDESSTLMRSGTIIYIDSSRGTLGFNTATSTIIPLTTYDTTTGGIYGSSPIIFYPNYTNGWYLQYPGSEMNSDGNDWKRPTPIANGIFYILHDSTLVAVRGTQQ